MYVPASNPRALAKAGTLAADVLIFDLEDAVAPEAKDTARAQLAQAIEAGGFGARRLVVRVNAADTAWHEDDLATVARVRPDAVLLPKVSSVDELEAFAARCAAHDLDDRVAVWAMIETTAGLLDLDAIVRAGRRLAPALDCLIVGTNDIVKETGVSPGDGRLYLLPWLMQVVLVAKRHGLCVLDGVWNDFSDQAGFDQEAAQSVKMGFDGKTLIHPTQIAPANRFFTPHPDAVAEARRIVAAFAEPGNAGKGVINLAGKMVERLHLAQAEKLLAVVEAIEARG